jgi:hypothetical protein
MLLVTTTSSSDVNRVSGLAQGCFNIRSNFLTGGLFTKISTN